MKRTTIAANYLKTISWFNGSVVDWATSKYDLAFNFDGAITSNNGVYVFVYRRLGTKGLLLKHGEILREINRSYYCADNYEYPCTFVDIDDITYLIHCPANYDRLEFENVETGELTTNVSSREAADIFHSRLEVSPDSSMFLSKGWVWHPLDKVSVFNIKDCVNNPNLLDQIEHDIRVGSALCTASFIDNTKILVGASDELIDEDEAPLLPPKYIAVWDLQTCKLSKPVKVEVEFGNLFAINSDYAWDMYIYPKVIELSTGKVIDAYPDFYSGKQRSAIYAESEFPQIVFDRVTGQIAVSGQDCIEIFSADS